MKHQNLVIAILSITASLLLLACIFVNTQRRADAAVTVAERDYKVCTSPLQRGGDALYIHDVRTGQMAIFMYDPQTRQIQVAAMGPMPGGQ